jgi:NAD(P)-dependent dehydrogenase (short-subunit alcohol dehydrogenase family)
MGLMDNRVCIITGGAGSLGLASAKLLHQEGASVMLVDLNEGDLKKAVVEIGGDRVAYAVADVSRQPDTRKYIDATMAKWSRIDVIFSNAGNHGDHKPIADYPEDNFDAVWAVHVKGAFLAAKYGLPHMAGRQLHHHVERRRRAWHAGGLRLYSGQARAGRFNAQPGARGG